MMFSPFAIRLWNAWIQNRPRSSKHVAGCTWTWICCLLILRQKRKDHVQNSRLLPWIQIEHATQDVVAWHAMISKNAAQSQNNLIHWQSLQHPIDNSIYPRGTIQKWNMHNTANGVPMKLNLHVLQKNWKLESRRTGRARWKSQSSPWLHRDASNEVQRDAYYLFRLLSLINNLPVGCVCSYVQSKMCACGSANDCSCTDPESFGQLLHSSKKPKTSKN